MDLVPVIAAILIAVTPLAVAAKSTSGAPNTPPRGTIETFYVPAFIKNGVPVLTRQNRWWDGSRWRPFDHPAETPIPKRQRRME